MINSWVDGIIRELSLKEAELQRQIDAIRKSIETLREGYDIGGQLPSILLPDNIARSPEPSVRITQEGVPETEPAEGWPA